MHIRTNKLYFIKNRDTDMQINDTDMQIRSDLCKLGRGYANQTVRTFNWPPNKRRDYANYVDYEAEYIKLDANYQCVYANQTLPYANENVDMQIRSLLLCQLMHLQDLIRAGYTNYQ